MTIVDFVKGHMGGDEIILLDGRNIPLRRRKQISLSILDPPNIRGREAGILYENNEEELSVKIVELTSRDYVPMCGGLTQVLGKSLIETNLKDRFNITVTDPITEVKLNTDAGIIPIRIEVKNGKAEKTFTGMRSYVRLCYSKGFEETKKVVKGVRTGAFNQIYTAIEYSDLARLYPKINFWQITPQAVKKLDELRIKLGEKHLYLVLYEKVSPNLFRVVFRFLPPDPLTMEGEFACGTGSTALGLILNHKSLINTVDGKSTIRLQLKDELKSTEYEFSTVILQMEKGKVIDAQFNHSNVEVVCEGRMFIR